MYFIWNIRNCCFRFISLCSPKKSLFLLNSNKSSSVLHTYHSFSCQLQISTTYQLKNCRYVLETLQLFLLQNRVYSVARGAVHGAYVSSVLCWRPPAHDGIAQSSPSQLAWCRSTTNCSSWKMPRWNEKRSTEQRQQAASVHCTIMHFDEIFVWCSC